MRRLALALALFVCLGGVAWGFIHVDTQKSFRNSSTRYGVEITEKHGADRGSLYRAGPLSSQFKRDDAGGGYKKIVRRSFDLGVDGIYISQGNLDSKARSYLSNNVARFKINPDDLKLTTYYPGFPEHKSLSVLKYVQTYKGLQVYSSRVVMAVQDGKLVTLKSNYYPGVDISTKPKLSEVDILKAVERDVGVPIRKGGLKPRMTFNVNDMQVQQFLGGAAVGTNVEDISLIVYPRHTRNGFEYRLAYKVELGLIKSPPAKWVYFVDANNGEVLEKHNKVVFSTLSGQVTGPIYPEHTNQSQVVKGFWNETLYDASDVSVNNVFWSGSGNDLLNSIITTSSIDLTGATSANLTFDTKYFIESGWDYGYAMISTDGTNFDIVATYTGSQSTWGTKNIDISTYTGQPVWIGFFYETDSIVIWDGWYLDNIAVVTDSGIVFNDTADNLTNWTNSGFSVVQEQEYNPLGNTGADGYYNLSGLPGNFTLYSELKGSFVDVNNDNQTDAFHETNITTPSTYSWNWSDYDTSDRNEESNMFYHVNLVHDFFTNGSPFDINSMDYQMIATVEYPGTCNAFATGTDIYFYGAGGGCEATSLLSDVIYHEYTHNVVDHVYTVTLPYSGESGALNEGWADYFASTINNNSCMAEGFFIGGDCLRELNNTFRYPDDIVGEVHDDSRIVSGAMWDLRQMIGAEATGALVINAMKLEPFNFTEYLDDIIIADDDNANLSDGTPNLLEICTSFYENHGIYSPYCNILYPDIDVSPTSLVINLYPGNSTNRTLTIENTGGDVLNFNVSTDAGIFTGATIFSYDFESGAPGWTHYWINGSNITDNWTLSTNRSSSPSHSWYSGMEIATWSNGGDTALESPTIDLTGVSDPYLTFNTWYYLDNNPAGYGDGGIVEIWNGTDWVQVSPIGGYPVTLSSGYDNPLEGMPAYGGQSNDWENELFNLSDFSGQTIKIRFHVGWDYGTYGEKEGWYIDDVSIISGGTQWLTVSPTSDTIDVGNSTNLTATINTTGMPSGPYIANIIVESNDPDENPFYLPVTLNVVDPTPPVVTIISPANTTYNLSTVPLVYSVNKYIAWAGYSLDGQANVTITGNTTITNISNGLHNLTVTVQDYMGVMNASTVWFTIASPDIWVSPSEINATLYQEDTSNRTLTIGNDGESDLIWNVTVLKFFDDFESGNLAWTSTGLWHSVDTLSNPCALSSSPTNSWWYGEDNTCTYDNGTANSGRLISPVITIPADGASLSFMSYEETECGGVAGCPYDVRTVSVNSSGGMIELWNSTNGSTEGTWHRKSFDLSAFAGQDVQIIFTFDTLDSIANDYAGWYIDDVVVNGTVQWLSVTPTNGTVDVGNQTNVTLTINATGLDNGTYTASIRIDSNDLGDTPLFVPVSPNVIPRPPDVVFSAPNTKGKKSSLKNISIEMNTSSSVGAIQLELRYNSTVVNATGATAGTAAAGALFSSNVNNSVGKVTVAIIKTAPGLNTNGSIADITFNVTGKDGDTTPLDIVVVTLEDPGSNPLSYGVVNGSLTVYTRLKGDANDDTIITASDALLYLRKAVGQDISPHSLDPVADDVTCDGQITASDALKVLRKAVGQDLSQEACPWT